jgi:serine/threonine-protein kinase
MSLNPGTKLGSYEILEPIGAGGMGEVYRARDTKLGREVAIKVLPEAFAQNQERLARFEREARLLASLNHPNIATLFGLEQSDGVVFLAMELAEGETLAQRLRRGPIPVKDTLPIFKQIAEALEAAHEKGIIHRDLKPANIKVSSEDKVKVLDFGLAKAMSGDPVKGELSESPTITRDATATGVILGTAAYMSPEQARGRTVDKRTDIWALGCCLYEALTGKTPFVGETVTDTLAKIVEREPYWEALPKGTPSPVHRLLRRCLRKDQNRRFRDAGDVRIEIEEALEKGTGSEVSSPKTMSRAVPWVVVALMAVIVGAVVLWSIIRATPGITSLMRLELPMAMPLSFEGVGASSLAVSPDGTTLGCVVTEGDRRQIVLRSLDEAEDHPIPGTVNGVGPFLSRDGQWLGFFADGKLKKVSIGGGTPQTLCDAPIPFGATWSANDIIVFAPLDYSGLAKVSATGGEVHALTNLDAENGELAHRWPHFLPGGEAVLFTTYTERGSQIVVQRLGSDERQVLVEGGADARYLATGHLAYLQGSSSLVVAPFDRHNLRLTGPPIPIVDDVATARGAGQFAFSHLGWLAYVPSVGPQQGLVWVDRTGDAEQLTAPPRAYSFARLSPDGQRLTVFIEGEPDVWVLDLARNTITRLTFEGLSGPGIWSPDGAYLAFSSWRGGHRNIFRMRADGRGDVEQLTTTELTSNANSWSPDGRTIVFTERHPESGRDLILLDLEEGKDLRPFLRTPFNEGAAKFSPNGKRLAYVSDESGQAEIYVRPYPGPGRKWQISAGGGTEPAWAPDGRMLFYRSGYRMMAVEITLQPDFRPGKPRLLFERPYRKALWGANYDVAPDGARFVMIQGGEDLTSDSGVKIVLNWFEELKEPVPTN